MLNLLGRKWANDDIINILSNASDDFNWYVLTFTNKKLFSIDVTFKERFVSFLVIEKKGSDLFLSLNIDSKLGAFSLPKLTNFISTNKTKSIADKDKINTINEIKKDLSIDNDVSLSNQRDRLSFCLNNYTTEERMKIISFLSIVDGSVPDIFIELNLSNCTSDQANAVYDRLLEVNITNK